MLQYAYGKKQLYVFNIEILTRDMAQQYREWRVYANNMDSLTMLRKTIKKKKLQLLSPTCCIAKRVRQM